MIKLKPLIGEAWFEKLKSEIEKQYFIDLAAKLVKEYSTYRIYPTANDIFKAFLLTPPHSTRVVMVGLDPYPSNDHADGIAFSSKQKETPFSLQRLFRELDRDIFKTKDYKEFISILPTNSLEQWCKRGVLLLNSSLTVRAGQVGSHHDLGWQQFNNVVIQHLVKDTVPKVFIGLGKEGQTVLTKSTDLLTSNHFYLPVGHPASGAYGKDTFSGSGIFWKTNHYFYKQGLEPIDWRLDE